MVKGNEKHMINVKECAAKSLGITTQRLINFLNSQTRGVLEVAAIKKLLKNTGFEKYQIKIDNTTGSNISKEKIIDSDN